MTLHVCTLADRPGLEPALDPLVAAGWPRFTLESPLDRAYWGRLLGEFADYQALLADGEGRLLGAGHSVPFRWDGRPACRAVGTGCSPRP